MAALQKICHRNSKNRILKNQNHQFCKQKKETKSLTMQKNLQLRKNHMKNSKPPTLQNHMKIQNLQHYKITWKIQNRRQLQKNSHTKLSVRKNFFLDKHFLISKFFSCSVTHEVNHRRRFTCPHRERSGYRPGHLVETSHVVRISFGEAPLNAAIKGGVWLELVNVFFCRDA